MWTFKEIILIDLTTKRLFSDVRKGVGSNTKVYEMKLGGLKLHMPRETLHLHR